MGDCSCSTYDGDCRTLANGEKPQALRCMQLIRSGVDRENSLLTLGIVRKTQLPMLWKPHQSQLIADTCATDGKTTQKEMTYSNPRKSYMQDHNSAATNVAVELGLQNSTCDTCHASIGQRSSFRIWSDGQQTSGMRCLWMSCRVRCIDRNDTWRGCSISSTASVQQDNDDSISVLPERCQH